MQRSPHPHAAVVFYDWLLSHEGQSKMTDLTGRIAVRKGIKHIPWVQELMQKEFVFITPSLIGPALKETTELYNQIFGIHRTK
jgi:ABC-type glycerol-3-phosphate transport system substrate-binding protein